MKTITNIINPALAAFAFAFFALVPTTRAVSPPPDGCYPGFTTAEGCNALNSLTTGAGNTGVGWGSLSSDTTGSFSTGLGAGALLLNNGDSNTATGAVALLLNTTGANNTANGADALVNNDTGDDNTAVGASALLSNTTGFQNIAVGSQALFSNTAGDKNLAVGTSALLSLTSGEANIAVGGASLSLSQSVNNNTALGRRALFRAQGDQNTGLGFFVGSNLNDGGTNNIYIGNVGPVPIGTESNTIRLGTQTATVATVGNPPVESHPMPAHTATYIAGISGTPVTGDPVVVDANGQLGTAMSSARFKTQIKPMDRSSAAILALKPVTFRYKPEIDPNGVPQFGLVAEEVEKVNPDLVSRDRDGKAYTVRYEAVNAMLLNEFLKEHHQLQDLKEIVADQQKQIKALTSGLQKVGAQVQLSKFATGRIRRGGPAPQTVVDNQ